MSSSSVPDQAADAELFPGTTQRSLLPGPAQTFRDHVPDAANAEQHPLQSPVLLPVVRVQAPLRLCPLDPPVLGPTGGLPGHELADPGGAPARAPPERLPLDDGQPRVLRGPAIHSEPEDGEEDEEEAVLGSLQRRALLYRVVRLVPVSYL